ncbi:ribosome small subunit-dependent GTPase A [Leptospira sp. GIMC2001]|uniref:ribosome small subunit-dependent GTPase A n=1 Tax=Leptospira sp. GIMC2001 TaxID=1513297 RepID=UPI00234BAEB8|nr:GTPase RsgA [Leptospira sp. GIMC2001]WCL51163.1 GTPase RsgA [Leptospira sp. GIMC2001]
MTLEDLGYNIDLEQYAKDHNLQSFEVGRVVAEHKEKYIVKTINSEYQAEVTGKLRFTAENRFDFPAVGDWVAITVYDESQCLIHEIYPRRTILSRKSVSKNFESQILATNIDYGIIVTAVDHNFNINRIERYLTICNASKIEPIIVLNKIDLIDTDRKVEILYEINQRIFHTPIITLSSVTLEGISKIKNLILKTKTYCLLGSSGVGKSTILNTLAERFLMNTGSISLIHNKGKHITTHRDSLFQNYISSLENSRSYSIT